MQEVLVQIAGAGRAYAYAWNGDPLAVGDWVTLPGNVVSEEGTEGMVSGFGRGGYTGRLKPVIAKRERPNLWVARMRAVRSRPEATRIYHRAVAAGVGDELLRQIVSAGDAALGLVRDA
jgi:hypothetical protein